MKQIWQVVGISVGIVFWVALPSVFAGSAKIGVIDVEKIMRESVAARDARGLFLLDVEAKRAVLRSKEKEIRRMETVPEAQQGDLSTNDKNKKAAESPLNFRISAKFGSVNQIRTTTTVWQSADSCTASTIS